MNSVSRYSVRNRQMKKLNRSIKKTQAHVDEAAKGFLNLSNMINKTMNDLEEIDESSVTYVAKEERITDKIKNLTILRREANDIFTYLFNELVKKELLYQRLASGEIGVRSHSPKGSSRARSTRRTRSI